MTQPRFHLRPPSRGLTLVELLVTLVVCAVLLMLIFAGGSRVVESSRMTQCAGNLRQLATAAIAYAGDHQQRLPSVSSWPLGGQPSWYITLGPYLQVPYGKKLTFDFLHCPSVKVSDPNQAFATYGVNYRYVFFVEALDQTNEERKSVYHGSMRLNLVPRNAFLFGDSGTPGQGNQGAIYSPYWWLMTRDSDGDGIPDSNTAIGGGPYNWMAFRHHKTANVVLADGSVRNITPHQWVTDDGNLWGPDLKK